jgi:DNA-directed RNA polymerase subunit M/transcription elongation factor TFIIS
MVKFCPKCDNLFSHKIDETTSKLSYICSACGNTEDVVDHCIIINELNTKVQDYPLNVNMIHDITLPRTKHVPCPNPDCSFKKKEEDANAGPAENPEIIIFQYNPKMLKTGYMCTSCKTYWKN